MLCVYVSACASSEPAATQEEEVEETAARVVVNAQEAELDPYEEEIEETLDGIEMVPIPSGSIVVETEEGSERVDVGPFWISSTEITWDVFDVYAFDSGGSDEGDPDEVILRPSKPYGAPDRGFGHRGYAAISMTYLVAEEFAEWLSETTGKKYRVPTEAEWEYACRAGRDEDIPEEALEQRAWYWDNAFDETHPVGELEPNAFGLHDMLGNAAEWCTGLDGEPLACGGSFVNAADEVGCSARMTPSPKWQETDPQIPKSRFWLTDGPFMGFRIIRVP